jgi:hypothetical protein
VRDSIAARVDELTVITPEVLDDFELALRNPPLDPISGQWHCVSPQDWIDFSIHAISRHIILKRHSVGFFPAAFRLDFTVLYYRPRDTHDGQWCVQ